MSSFRLQLISAISLSFLAFTPAFSIDEATQARLKELLERARSGRTLSTRDMAPEKKEESPKPVVTPPSTPSAQPVINVNQINNSGAQSSEDILNQYKEKREAQKEEAIKKPEPIIETPKPAPVTKPTAQPVSKPTAQPVSKPVSQPVSKPKVETIKPKAQEPIKVETKNEVKQSPLETITMPGAKGTSDTSNSEITDPSQLDNNVLDGTRAVTPDGGNANKTAAEREADYQLVLRKSLKSLEEDAWNEVKYNMSEARDYFAREKETYKEPKLDNYYKVVMAFQRFAEGGLELDQGDFADYEEAEALYLDASDLLDEAERGLGDDLSSKNIKEIINTVRKYIDEDLDYIEEMVGVE